MCKLIEAEIAKANAARARRAGEALPHSAEALDPEDEGEPVTPTRKLKRALMLERFKALVDSMYDEREERLVAREIGEVFT